MDALAGAAGVTTGAVYKHFDGKSDLFAALIETELGRTERRFGTISPRTRPPSARHGPTT